MDTSHTMKQTLSRFPAARRARHARSSSAYRFLTRGTVLESHTSRQQPINRCLICLRTDLKGMIAVTSRMKICEYLNISKRTLRVDYATNRIFAQALKARSFAPVFLTAGFGHIRYEARKRNGRHTDRCCAAGPRGSRCNISSADGSFAAIRFSSAPGC